MKKSSQAIDWSIRIICSLFLIPIIVFVYCYFWGNIPQTTGTTYVGALTLHDGDKPLEDSTIVLEANLYNNSKGNGKVLYELLFTTYKGTDTANVYGKGMQSYGAPNSPYSTSVVEKSNGYSIFCTEKDIFYAMHISNLYYYDLCIEGERKIAMSSPSALSADKGLIISIADQMAMLKFKKDRMLESNFWEDSNVLHMHIDSYYYIDPAYFFMTMYNSVKSLKAGTHYVTIDLSDFFDVYLQGDDGQFDKLTATQEYTFVTCKINVHDDGVTSTKQSMFGAIASNNAKTEIGKDKYTEFWNVENNYIITNKDFDNLNGYLKIKRSVVEMLSKYDRVRCNVTINLDDEEDVKGFAVYGLNGIKINQITIKSNKNVTFVVMDKALLDTNVRKIVTNSTIKIRSAEELPCEVEVIQ